MNVANHIIQTVENHAAALARKDVKWIVTHNAIQIKIISGVIGLNGPQLVVHVAKCKQEQDIV